MRISDWSSGVVSADLQNIVAITAFDVVVAGIAIKRVIAVVAIKRIVARAASEDIGIGNIPIVYGVLTALQPDRSQRNRLLVQDRSIRKDNLHHSEAARTVAKDVVKTCRPRG